MTKCPSHSPNSPRFCPLVRPETCSPGVPVGTGTRCQDVRWPLDPRIKGKPDRARSSNFQPGRQSTPLADPTASALSP